MRARARRVDSRSCLTRDSRALRIPPPAPPRAWCTPHAAAAVYVILGSAAACSGLLAERVASCRTLSDADVTGAGAGCHVRQLACGHAPRSAHLSPLRRRAALRFPCLATAGDVLPVACAHKYIRSHARMQARARIQRERARARARERESEKRERRERETRERERERETHAPHALNTRTHIHRRTRAARRRGGDSKGGWGKKRQAEDRGRAPGICVRSKLVSAQMCTYYICIDIHAGA